MSTEATANHNSMRRHHQSSQCTLMWGARLLPSECIDFIVSPTYINYKLLCRERTETIAQTNFHLLLSILARL